MSDLHEILAGYIPKDAKSLLDVGCGSTGAIQKIAPHVRQIVSIDVDQRGVDLSKRQGLDARLIDMRLMEQCFGSDSFDVVFFKDSLEHVAKADADDVVRQAKAIARCLVIAEVPVGAVGDNPWDEGPFKHKHHWEPDELRALGFAVDLIENYHGEGRHAMVGTWRKAPLAPELGRGQG